jgi:hypothetical protein
MSSVDRTNWRDEKLSLRHRDWGMDCPAVDIDFLLCEYNHSKPVALIDYKLRENANKGYRHDSSIRTVANLADCANIPFFVVYYNCLNNCWQFMLVPINKIASDNKVEYHSKWLTESEYVNFLYSLRGYNIQKYIGVDATLKPLCSELPITINYNTNLDEIERKGNETILRAFSIES